MKDLRIIVVGASMGGIDFFLKLVSQLSSDWPVAVFIVQHIASMHRSQLDRILSGRTSLTVEPGENNKPILPGHIYITPTDQHLIVKEGYMKVSYGPTENGSRPSINTLFRSAAVAYRHRTIGVLLTGLLSDGTRGLQAIHECGGITVVQDPEEAPYPEMPTNAIRGAVVNYVVRVEEMGELFEALLVDVPPPQHQVPVKLRKQVEIAETPVIAVSEDQKDELDHQAVPISESSPNIENSLWSVLQFMQERTNMLENLVMGERVKGRERMAENFARKAEESKIHTQNLRSHLLKITNSIANPAD